MDLSINYLWLSLFVVFGISLALAFIVWRKQADQKLSAFKRLLKKSHAEQKDLRLQIDELHQANRQLHHGFMQLSENLQQVNQQQQQLSFQEPPNKLYSRAIKMIELGADIDEIITECELPKAEAELLINLNKQSLLPQS